MSIKFVTRLHKAITNPQGQHPIVLQVIWGKNVRRKRIKMWAYPEQWDFDNQEFRKGLHGRWELNKKLEEAEKKANDIYKRHFATRSFNFAQFSELFSEVRSDKKTVIEFCHEVSHQFLKRDQANSYNDYQSLVKAIRKISPKDLSWEEFNEDWLYKFEDYFTSGGAKCFNYMKTLRALYNKAVKARIVDYRNNPFKNPYTNPYGYEFARLKKSRRSKTNENRIKDLTRKQLLKLKIYEPLTDKEREYLDVWWFSFYMFGVNLTDIAKLRRQDLRDGRWFYERSKTGTGLKKGKPILPEAREILERIDTGGKYIFPILTPQYDKDALTVANRIRYYGSNTRKAFYKISKRVELNGYFTFYSARHSSATLALNEGADRNTVSHLLDHENLSTLDNYAGRADDQKVLEAMELLRV